MPSALSAAAKAAVRLAAMAWEKIGENADVSAGSSIDVTAREG